MPQPKAPANPFYFLLIAMGVLFTITACAFFVVTLQETNPDQSRPPGGLMTFLGHYGMTALMVELAGLAVATFGAIYADNYWSRRAKPSSEDPADESESIRRD